VTWVNRQGQEVEIAPWLRVVVRVLVNGTLGVVLVGSLVFSSYQLINSSPAGMLLGIEVAVVPFAAGVIAGETRRRRRHVFSAAARNAHIVILASLAASMPLLLHCSWSGRRSDAPKISPSLADT
jgi:hypothetical protein